MSEFDTQDFKNWTVWAIEANRTVWEQINQSVTRDPDKAYRAWNAYKDWMRHEVCGLAKEARAK